MSTSNTSMPVPNAPAAAPSSVELIFSNLPPELAQLVVAALQEHALHLEEIACATKAEHGTSGERYHRQMRRDAERLAAVAARAHMVPSGSVAAHIRLFDEDIDGEHCGTGECTRPARAQITAGESQPRAGSSEWLCLECAEHIMFWLGFLGCSVDATRESPQAPAGVRVPDTDK